MKNYYGYILVWVLVWTLASCGADAYMKKGDQYLAIGEYFDAAEQYKKAYTNTPTKERTTRGQRAKKLAECYRRINFSQKAIAAYNNVIRYNQADSLTHLRLAQQLMKTGNYRQAEKAFAIAADSLPQSKIVKNGLLSAKNATQWKKEGSAYTVKRENVFASRRADYSPMLAGDDNDRLYFTSTRPSTKGDELSGITGTKTADIFFSQKDEKGKWTKPQNIDTELNSDYDEGACSFSPDGRTMYLTQCKSDPSYPRYATICTSQRNDASWGKSTELTISKDTLSSFAHPAVSPDGQWLYFSSDMPGGYGGLDIWKIRLGKDGVEGGVENLGNKINTEGDEMFPTFRPNGDLYFSSNGHPGMGGLDIFIAKTDTMGNGYVIEHPGYPLNSEADDFGMTFEGLKNQGYFSSNRGDARGWDHIFSFYNPEIVQTVTGWVYEKDGYELPAALVYMVGNDGTNLKLNVKGDGSFTQQIKPNVDYVFLGTCKGYLNHQQQLRVEPASESCDTVLQFPLASIMAPVLIDNIFYDFDRATLRPESKTSLDELVKLLNENPNITIELSAHCDYKGSAAYNKQLSQRRAESVVNYLIEKGIARERLTPVGYGKEKPKTIKKKVAERYEFLKADDVLSEEFIRQLKPEEQEICNQLNRRTEFRVLRTTYKMF
ncbi:MAG: OmpA family protein [Prevotella sp.]|nr:OmpA family protein [Prevotella sp.]MDD6864326.1 OmpA family protein [Prevotella sp.]MDD7224678.1 OmpA family protein [Prevotella sp.]